jgi:hypothetical protein
LGVQPFQIGRGFDQPHARIAENDLAVADAVGEYAQLKIPCGGLDFIQSAFVQSVKHDAQFPRHPAPLS